MEVNGILSITEEGGMGIKGRIPWYLDLNFRRLTELTTECPDPNKKNAVLMGRITWESIRPDARPLADRLNVILSSTLISTDSNVLVFRTIGEAISSLEANPLVNKVFVIGGATLYNICLAAGIFNQLYITKILTHIPCETFVDNTLRLSDGYVLTSKSEIKRENKIRFQFQTLTRRLFASQ